MKLSHRIQILAALVSIVFVGNLLADDPKPEDWTAPARAARKKNPIPSDEKSIAAGKLVYTAQCLSCHGTSGKGDGPASKDLNPRPRDLADARVVAQSDGALFWKVTEGRKPMPSFEKLINEDERWQVINYLRTLAPTSSK